MKERTVKDLKRDASKVKHEMDELERTAYGMTFDELIRIMAGSGKTAEGATYIDQKEGEGYVQD